MGRIVIKELGSLSPCFDDEFVWSESLKGFKPFCEIVSADESVEVLTQLLM